MPQIAVIADACVGSSSVVAANADIVIAAEGCDYYLNPGDENAKADIAAQDADDAIDKARQLITMLPSNNPSAVAYDFDSSAMPPCEAFQM